MSPSLCYLSQLIAKLISIYIGLLLLYAVVSWIPSLRGRWTDYLAMVIEPVLLPLRRIIPPAGAIDLSYLVLLLLLQFIRAALLSQPCYVV